MTTSKLCVVALLGAMSAPVAAQPSVRVGVDVNVGDTYDTVAPGDPVESVDVFYDQLTPYGAWVDEPDVGRVFVPDTRDYVPYTAGHWQYTNLGFVWISSEPFAWATAHYGRWAYSRYYGRWYWLPDTTWGPAWVEWRQDGDDFGWAPLAPDIVVRAGWQPPAEAWHFCGAPHLLDPNVTRYYEPRERVAEIHRRARPIEHYATVSNARVIVGPPPAILREHHVTVRPVRVEPRTVGRWTAPEAHAQAERAREHRATFETQNEQRIQRNTQLHAAHVKVIETHPEIKAQVTARTRGDDHRASPAAPGSRAEPARTSPDHRPGEPARVEPGRPEREHAAPGTPSERAPTQPTPPARAEQRPNRPTPASPPASEPRRDQRPAQEHGRDPRATEPARPAQPQQPAEQPGREQAPRERAVPNQPPAQQHTTPPTAPRAPGPAPRPPESRPPLEQHAAPTPANPRPADSSHRAPEPRPPAQAQPEQRREPPAAEHREPDRKQPDRKEPDRKEPDRKEPDRH